MITIRRFFVTITSISLIIYYSLFGIYYYDHRDRLINLLLESSFTVIEEDSRFIFSGLDKIEEIDYYKSLLNRSVYNISTLESIIFAYGEYILSTTDPSIRAIPSQSETITRKQSKEYTNIDFNDFNSIKIEDEYFIGGEEIKIQIYGILDKDFITKEINDSYFYLFLLVGFPPLIILLMYYFFNKKYILNPMKDLGSYAYYNTYPPSSFKITEIEDVRSSLEQTFFRLEHEKSELFRMSTTDDLCGLSNRTALIERIKWLITDSDNIEKGNLDFAMLYIDLDNFKSINDSFGHKVGDSLLKEISVMLKSIVKNSDIIARIGGDEFVVIVPYKGNDKELVKLSETIMENLSKSWKIKERLINITCSIGIVLYPKDGDNVTTLMKNADIAMYEAKKLGKRRYHFFTEELNQRVQEEIEIDLEMYQSLSDGDFQLLYQPKIKLTDESISGAEALIRWNHPEKGLISPDKFIRIAESNGFIKNLGEWIITKSIEDTKHIVENFDPNFKMSINISVKQMKEENLFQYIVDELNRFNLSPKNFEIEITEGIFIEASVDSVEIETLHKLRDYGITISLDDFGTGYSSLSYLKKLPIDTLKIDKSFMDDYNAMSGSVIIESIVSLSHALGYTVVAEGIEEIDQVRLLRSLGCEMLQGYYYSRPIDINSLHEFILHCDDIKVFDIPMKKLDINNMK